ncbi:hypothetical protein IHEIED_03379 [Methylorubrum populi]
MPPHPDMTTPALAPEVREDLFYIVDLRPEWNKNPYVSFWRPDDAGYCYSLAWAGKYTAERVAQGGSYYTYKAWTSPKGPGRLFTRFAVRCADVEAFGEAPDTEGRGRIDGNTGPVLRMSGAMRNALRRLRCSPKAPLDTPPADTGEAGR